MQRPRRDCNGRAAISRTAARRARRQAMTDGRKTLEELRRAAAAKAPADGARRRHEDHRARAVGRGAPPRLAAGDDPPREIHRGRRTPRDTRRAIRHRRADRRPAAQHGRRRRPARASDAGLHAQSSTRCAERPTPSGTSGFRRPPSPESCWRRTSRAPSGPRSWTAWPRPIFCKAPSTGCGASLSPS